MCSPARYRRNDFGRSVLIPAVSSDEQRVYISSSSQPLLCLYHCYYAPFLRPEWVNLVQAADVFEGPIHSAALTNAPELALRAGCRSAAGFSRTMQVTLQCLVYPLLCEHFIGTGISITE